MMGIMGDVLFVVWRESVEALLVIGILYAWLRRQPEAGQGLRYLWLGVGLGLGAAVLLGTMVLKAASLLDGDSGEIFQIAMVLFASALIVQMVCWMRRHGRTLKAELEQGMQRNLASHNWWGMVVVIVIAIAREGSETVIFLYGLGVQQQGGGLLSFVFSALVGLGLAFATFALLQAGTRVLSWRTFFRFSEAMLLLLAAALLTTGVEKLVSLGWLPGLVDPLWDSSWLLDDSTTTGGLVAALTGYRAHPALTMLIAYVAYWGVVSWLLRAPALSGKAPSQVAAARG